MAEMQHGNLLRYYGIEQQSNSIVFTSIQHEEDILIGCAKESMPAIQSDKTILLFVSISINGILERQMNLSELLQKKFDLSCSVVFEQTSNSFFAYIRTGVVATTDTCWSEILNTLYVLQNHSFGIIVDKDCLGGAVEHLMKCFEKGILSSNVLEQCCNVALMHNAAFFHVLKGCDGHSINLFHRRFI